MHREAYQQAGPVAGNTNQAHNNHVKGAEVQRQKAELISGEVLIGVAEDHMQHLRGKVRRHPDILRHHKGQVLLRAHLLREAATVVNAAAALADHHDDN